MTIHPVAVSLATRFKNRLQTGEVMEGFEEYEPQDDDMTSLYENIPRIAATHEELREICLQIQKLLGGKGAVDDQSGYYVNGVWARIFVGTDENPEDEIRIILVMVRQQP